MLIASFISGLAAITQIASEPCPGEAEYCWREGEDVILANSEDAAFFMPYLQAGRTRFETLYGIEAPKAALVFDNIDQSELIEADYEVILPWFLPSERDAILRETIETSVRAQTEGIPEAQVQAILAQAIEQAGLPAQAPAIDNEAALAGAAMHELGHLWFIGSFDWAELENTQEYYGADTAPDWLDEVGAVLLENDFLTESRRSHLAEAWRGETEVQLVPLSHYFSIDHPLLATIRQQDVIRERARAQVGENGGGTVAISLSGEEAQALLSGADGMDPALFYAQSRGFIDYVVARSGSEQYFVDATLAILEGNTFGDWHTDAAAHYGLPASLDALQADWENWLGETYGSPPD